MLVKRYKGMLFITSEKRDLSKILDTIILGHQEQSQGQLLAVIWNDYLQVSPFASRITRKHAAKKKDF